MHHGLIRFECLQNSAILVYYFWESSCSRRVSKSSFTTVWRTSFVLHTNQGGRASFYTLWPVIEAFYMTSCCEGLAMASNSLLQCNTTSIWVMWIVQINSEVNWRYHDPGKPIGRKEWSNTWWIRPIRTHTSFGVIINHRRISVIEIDVYLLRNWLKGLYEAQISYTNRQSVSIVCGVVVRSILTPGLENVKHSPPGVPTYSIVRAVERLIIVWHVKWVYACHLDASRPIMIRRGCHTSALINSGSEYVSGHLGVYRWPQMNSECNHISVIECLYTIELLHWIIHIYT